MLNSPTVLACTVASAVPTGSPSRSRRTTVAEPRDRAARQQCDDRTSERRGRAASSSPLPCAPMRRARPLCVRGAPPDRGSEADGPAGRPMAGPSPPRFPPVRARALQGRCRAPRAGPPGQPTRRTAAARAQSAIPLRARPLVPCRQRRVGVERDRRGAVELRVLQPADGGGESAVPAKQLDRFLARGLGVLAGMGGVDLVHGVPGHTGDRLPLSETRASSISSGYIEATWWTTTPTVRSASPFGDGELGGGRPGREQRGDDKLAIGRR